MNQTLEYIVNRIEKQDPLHAKKLKRNLKSLDGNYVIRADFFIDKYKQYLESTGRDLDYGVDSYLRMIADFMYEQLRFMETGKYSNTSFEEVNRRVYGNPDVMEYFMNGLLLSQVLWRHHYAILTFFCEKFPFYGTGINSYLEIGGGHGLFISEAIDVLGEAVDYSLLDISETSIEVSKKFICRDSVDYILSDIFEYQTTKKYDFISMGEVLEHVEDPVALLKKIKGLLSPEGTLFMTTPTNAPSIDHIYLFKNAGDIQKIIKSAGLRILDEIQVYSEDLPEEMAEKLKITMMYGCFLSKV